MRRPWRTTAIALFAGSVLLSLLWGDRVLALGADGHRLLRQYTELLQVAHESAGTAVAYEDLVFSSVHGMLGELDPHTSFLPPMAYDRMRERQQSSFYGLGILVGMRNNQLTVISPLEGTPASRMGIRAGDVISQIDGEETSEMTLDDAVQRLKGPKDTQVGITVERTGLTTPLELTITRAEIPLDTVHYASIIAPGVGYFRLSDFSRSTGREVAEALADLREQGMERLVLDLRNNGGGLLDQAIDVADQFVRQGELIVETRGRTRGSHQQYVAEGQHVPFGLPMVVLVNSGSASAAEILAGAIQDHDIGLIAGTPTWGKGLVQTVYTLSYGSALALTTAKYYTPSGRLIQRDYSSYYDYYLHDDDDGPIVPPESPVFHTDLGREVYGGGGITPDVFVEANDTPELVQFLLARTAFFNFGVDYANRHAEVDEEWAPSEGVLDEFERWLVDQEIVASDELDELRTDPALRDAIALQIRAEVFRSLFGSDAWYRVFSQADDQVQEALRLLPKAEELLVRRLELDIMDQTQVADGSLTSRP